MKFCIFTPTPQREELGGLLVANFFHLFPRKNGLKFVTPKTSEIFTTFSTARREIYHLELALGATYRKTLQKTPALPIRGTLDGGLGKQLLQHTHALGTLHPEPLHTAARPRPQARATCSKKARDTRLSLVNYESHSLLLQSACS